MSSDVAATVDLFNNLYTGWYCQLAASVIFLYDTCVTSDREAACFWTRKWTGAPLLFFLSKWISMTVYVMSLVQFATFTSDQVGVSPRSAYSAVNDQRACSCSRFQIALEAMSIAQYVPGAVFSALRAYVLSRSKILGLLALALSLAPVGANLVQFSYQLSGENFPPFGCLGADNVTEETALKLDTFRPIPYVLIVISRAPLIVADVLLIYITWTRLSGSALVREFRHSRRLSLTDVLFRDGTMYFVVMTILNVLHLVFSLTSLQTDVNGGSYVTVFTAPLTAILILRFLLDLQEANQAVVRVDADDPLHSSRGPYDTPSFISSLGAFINPDLPTSSDDELESHHVSCLDPEDEGEVQSLESQAA